MVVRIKTKQLFYQSLIFFALGQFCLPAAAEDGVDCSLSNINYLENPEMTRAERIEAMNRAFYDSLNRFEECTLSTNSNNSSTSASSGGSSASGSGTLSGTEGGGGTAEALNAESFESPLLSGTEPEATEGSESIDMEQTGLASDSKLEASEPNASTVAGSGAAPQDIPDANNDDVVAAQIRLAAEIEKDPEKKIRLWNEYRKYKGLPAVKNEEI